MSSETVISAKGLTKRYGDLVAVDGIDFAIRRGECFGMLGPNGAGKTSIIRMISCLSPVTEGELTVNDMDVASEQRAIKSSLGIVSQADSLDPDLSVMQNLVAYGRFFGLPRKRVEETAMEVLELLQLRTKVASRPDELSGGMRRRLLIARALLHEPKILLLDEPTTGLDPQSRHMVWEKLLYLKSQGVTILLTTHYMEEAAYLCDRLVVIDLGRILVEGSPKELVEEHAGEQVVEVRTSADGKQALLGIVQSRGLHFEDLGDSVFVYGENGILSTTADALEGYEMVRRPGSLEDVFLRLTGRSLREE